MTTLAWTLTGGLAAAVALLGATGTATRRRLRVTERRLAELEHHVAALDATTADALDTARAAAASRGPAAGPPPEPPRVVLEPLTGRLVKAVAISAGARRAVTRLARGARSTP